MDNYYGAEDEAYELGDPRRCPRHPSVVTSSRDGMFDGLCGECEYEIDGDPNAYPVLREESSPVPAATFSPVLDGGYADEDPGDLGF